MARASRNEGRTEAREPSRGEVLGRNGEILSRRPGGSDRAVTQYHVPSHLKEAGWDLQWVRASCLGKDDPANITDHMESGWRPVPADRPGFKEYFRITDAADIAREGLVLMERPIEFTRQAHEEDYRAAMSQRNSQIEDFALSELPSGFDRGYGKAAKRVNRSIEGAPAESYPVHEIGDE